MKRLNVLVGFECSGKVRDAFMDLGHSAISTDIASDYSQSKYAPFHVCSDFTLFLEHAALYGRKWDLIIMHPPCTALACSGNRWYGKGMEYYYKRLEALEQTKQWWDMAKKIAPHVALENPVGVLWNFLGVEPHYVQPWQFGHGETKNTGFALHNLPPLEPTNIVEGREQRIWKMPPSEERARMRSETFQGIADAMAKQWSEYILTTKGD